mgnify:CR=1 FL=1
MADPLVRFRPWPSLSPGAWWALFFGLIYFLGNDIVFYLAGRNAIVVYAVDYLPRLGLILWLWILSKGPQGAALLGLRSPGLGRLVLLSVMASVWGILIDQFGWIWLSMRLPSTAVLAVCPILPGFWRWVDAVGGSALVALSEEGVFRGLFLGAFLAGSTITRRREFIAVSAGSLLFGLAHWSLGIHAVVATTIWAVIPAYITLRYRSIWPAVVAHYLTDVVAFSGVLTPFVYSLL